MSDAQGTAEQQAQQDEQPAEPKWGDALDSGLIQERKDKLAEALWGWTPAQATEEQPGPFAGERLNGLEVYWLAACAVAGQDGETAAAARLLVDANERVSIRVVQLPLAGAWLGDAQLAGAYLRGAQLTGANLGWAHLEGAVLREAHLEGADLRQGQLAGAYLREVQLQGALLTGAQLAGAHLDGAQLAGASLTSAQLKGAILPWAQLAGADLHGAQLAGADLSSAQVAGADLTGASLDKATRLNGATLTGVLLDQVILDNTNLTVVEWDHVPVLGDELRADEAREQVGGEPSDAKGSRKTRQQRAEEYAAAVRAYRLLAVALQNTGLGEVAARYSYRAQIMQRKRRWHERRLSAYLGSAFLALFAGYGYRLGRVFVAYGLTVALFAALYLLTGVAGGGTHLSWQAVADAAQISLNAIHGRVFFAQFGLDTAQSWIATAESICGIVIEGVFVAVLIQRLFSR